MNAPPDDSEFARYLEKIGQFPELTPDEEREVYDKIAAWRDIAAELRESGGTSCAAA